MLHQHAKKNGQNMIVRKKLHVEKNLLVGVVYVVAGYANVVVNRVMLNYIQMDA